MKKITTLIVLACFLAACSGESAPEATPIPEGPVEEVAHEGIGVIKNITPSKSHVVIDHEDIPGFMEAMTMPFPLETPALAGDLAVGDSVRFTVIMAANDGFIRVLTPIK